jgi:tetratricopeptide (TPR) repeat protein
LKPRTKHILCFLFIFTGFGSFSQKEIADSLIKLLPKQKADTAKCLLLTDISRAYLAVSDFENALDYSQQQLELSEKLGFKRGEMTANNNIGLVHFYRSNYPKCLEYYFKALNVAEKAGYTGKALKILSNIGAVYYSTENYPKTIEVTNKVIKLAKELKDTTTLATQYSVLGLIQRHDAMFTKDSIKHLDLCIKALRNFQTAIFLDSMIGNKKNVSAFLTNVGLLYGEMKDPENELFYHLYSLKLKQEIGDEYGAGICFANIGIYYLRRSNFIAADTCLNIALRSAELTGDIENIQQMHAALSDLYEKENKLALSLDHYKKSVKYRDSILNAANTKKQLEIEMNYEYDKKEAILKAESQKEKEKQQLIIYSICIGLFLVLIFTGFIFNRFKVTQRQKRLIEIKEKETQAQKELIEEKNEEIISSIRYAKRIQQSLLPNEKYIEKNLKKK